MRVEKRITLPANPATVWKALTNPTLTKLYFFDFEVIADWKVGSPLVFQLESGAKHLIPVKGKITAIEPEKLLEHTCYAAEFEDVPEKHTKVRYTLVETDGGTELSVVQGEFPESETYDYHNTSWDLVLNGLKALLECEPDGT